LQDFFYARKIQTRSVAEKIREQVRHLLDVKASIRILPIYVDVSRFKGLTSVPHEGKNILWIGRFEPEKAPLEALEVLQGVLGRGVVARLMMLGTGRPEAELRQAARGLLSIS
jgi:glycosyltransferase involved in cell wall biosynthesis